MDVNNNKDLDYWHTKKRGLPDRDLREVEEKVKKLKQEAADRERVNCDFLNIIFSLNQQLEYQKNIIAMQDEKIKMSQTKAASPVKKIAIAKIPTSSTPHKDNPPVSLVNIFMDSYREGNYIVGCHYRDGIGVKKDYELAFKHFDMSAKKGNLDANYEVARCYFKGRGVTVDYKKAIYSLYAGSFSGHLDSIIKLGKCRLYGFGGIKKDLDAAFQDFSRAARGGYPKAVRYLALCYREGWGVTKNFGLSLKLLEGCVKKEDLRSYVGLGDYYFNGWGVTKNLNSAVTYYRNAANKGDIKAEFKLGVALVEEVKARTTPNSRKTNEWTKSEKFNEAITHIRNAAEKNNLEAINCLVEYFQLGWLEKNESEQKKLSEKAVELLKLKKLK